jgi:hypothetical protein
MCVCVCVCVCVCARARACVCVCCARAQARMVMARTRIPCPWTKTSQVPLRHQRHHLVLRHPLPRGTRRRSWRNHHRFSWPAVTCVVGTTAGGSRQSGPEASSAESTNGSRPSAVASSRSSSPERFFRASHSVSSLSTVMVPHGPPRPVGGRVSGALGAAVGEAKMPTVDGCAVVRVAYDGSGASGPFTMTLNHSGTVPAVSMASLSLDILCQVNETSRALLRSASRAGVACSRQPRRCEGRYVSCRAGAQARLRCNSGSLSHAARLSRRAQPINKKHQQEENRAAGSLVLLTLVVLRKQALHSPPPTTAHCTRLVSAKVDNPTPQGHLHDRPRMSASWPEHFRVSWAWPQLTASGSPKNAVPKMLPNLATKCAS